MSIAIKKLNDKDIFDSNDIKEIEKIKKTSMQRSRNVGA